MGRGSAEVCSGSRTEELKVSNQFRSTPQSGLPDLGFNLLLRRSIF